MPIHDWTRVEAGIFHAFHHEWISELARALNHGLLPDEYYALPEQFAAGFGPDVLTLQGLSNEAAGEGDQLDLRTARQGYEALATVRLQPVAETDMAFYRRKQKVVAVRHVSGDRVVAMIEIVSQGNKAVRRPLRKFVEKAAYLLDVGVHLLVIDLFPPGRLDPAGIHSEIWQEIAGDEPVAPLDKPLTLASYEAGDAVRAYLTCAAVGDVLAEMPLFFELGRAVSVPLEATYDAAFREMPLRWRRVL